MTASVVEFRGVDLVRNGRAILRDITWRVAAGEHWAIVGANGSGKTTLLRLAGGYLWPSRGSVSVLGHPFGTVDLRELRKRIGWVSSALAEMIHRNQSAVDIVLSGVAAAAALFGKPTDEQIARAHALLADLDCDSIAESRFGILSLGEQQKVLIARALMARPELLILDEACAGLDLRTREHLLDTVESLAGRGDITLIFVTHHIEEITASFSHVLILDGGTVAAQGAKDEVLTGETLSEAMDIHVSIQRQGGRYWPRIEGDGPRSYAPAPPRRP